MNTPVTTKIASVIVAVLASCLTLGSVVLLFDSAADRGTPIAVAAPGESHS